MNSQHVDGQLHKAKVNDVVIAFERPNPSVSDVLVEAGFQPPNECILVQLGHTGARALSLDERVELGRPGIEAFRAFRSDRTYRFTIDEREYEWGEATISERDLRIISTISDDQLLVVDCVQEACGVLRPGGSLDLAKRGTEHIRAKPRFVAVHFKKQKVRIERGSYSTEQLLRLLGVEEGYVLNLKADDGELVTLKPGDSLCVEDGMKFFSQPPSGGAS
jgi:hypothetical protein